MQTEIHVQVKDVYGMPKAYPMNTQAKLIAALAGTKTLTLDTLRLALTMGFQIVEIDRRGNRIPGTGAAQSVVARIAA